MMNEDDHMDQLFKDHFDGFAPSPSEEVWKGVVANGAMANGKKLGGPAYWKGGLWLSLGLLISFGLLQGYQVLRDSDENVALTVAKDISPVTGTQSNDPGNQQKSVAQLVENSDIQESLAKSEDIDQPKLHQQETQSVSVTQSDLTREPVAAEATTKVDASGKLDRLDQLADVVKADKDLKMSYNAVMNIGVTSNSVSPRSYSLTNLLDIDHLGFDNRLADWNTFNDPLSVKAKRDLSRSWMSKQTSEKKRGGHWFVSGSLVADPGISSHNNFLSGFDGLAFGAGKYLTPNSFAEVSLRGNWSHGFNMRVTYAHLFLPGRLRPYVQGGLTWGEDLKLRLGLGLMYAPQKMGKWRFFVAANYEGDFKAEEFSTGKTGVFEIGAQIKLSGTERVLSDNNWMNNVPLYELPTNWYVDASVNFSFDAKTKVVHYSVYMGKYLKKRLFIRGGLRIDRNNEVIPVQLQYYFLVRKQLRFGAYAGASMAIRPARLGAELGLIAYYEIKPNWSLFVAPVIFENSYYTERLFEMGVQLKLRKKNKK